MTKPLHLVIALAGICLTASALHASVSIDWQLANFLTSSGAAIPANSLGVIVADTAGNGFAATSTATSSSLAGVALSVGNFFGADDKIVDIFQANSLLGTGGEDFAVARTGATAYNYDALSVTSGSFAAGDAMAIYWFPTILTIGSTVTANTSFGFFTSSTVNAASNPGSTAIAFVAPANGSNKSLYYFTTTVVGAGGVAPASFQATQTVQVPEPSTFALLGLTTAGVLAFRRSRRA